ncbi:MAG TPA: PKD domain-containing protein, partial [Bacteroidales bacterium]|nr:PKD domain-containing protein [Bacteroidales bacterium]
DPIPACGNDPVVITPIITGGSGTWSSHNWSGDIGPLNNYFIETPTFRTLIAETYTLNYRVVDDNMCAGEGTVRVVVDAPDATFSHVVSMACTPATVEFSKDMIGMASWTWDFGDGTPVNTTDANPVHVFTNTTSTAIVYRTVSLTVQSNAGCFDTKTSMVTVYPAIIANLTADDDTVCHGNQLTFTADPGANIYKWDYGDGTPVVPGINTSRHMFMNSSGDPVTRTVEVVTTSLYGCSDSTTIDIVVMPMPQVQFTATPSSQTFQASGNNVTFADQTTPVSTYWKYIWDFGDGGSSTEQNPSHTYTGTGTYNVMLTVSNGKCSGNVSHPVIVLPIPPVADFDSIPSGCATWTITTHNTSLNTEAPGTTYRWDFGDGSYSTEREPVYTYFTPGEYRVELTVTGPGGVDMKSQVVRAYPSPKAYFEVSPTLVFVNDERVRCFNLSEGGDYWVWDFGDGDTSRVREPYHKYMEEGVYDITLWAYSNNGCSDMFILSPGVTVQPAGDVRFSTVFTPNKTGPIERTDLPTGGIEMDQFFFPPIRDKVIRYKLQIFNRLGVLIFESHDINIPWNGYYKNKLCPQGVYVWYVEGKYANGEPFKKVGDITLLH